jgi:hypothetical protein
MGSVRTVFSHCFGLEVSVSRGLNRSKHMKWRREQSEESGAYHVLMFGLADGNSVGKISAVVDMLIGGMLAIGVRYMLAFSGMPVVSVCTHEFGPVSVISKQSGAILLCGIDD